MHHKYDVTENLKLFIKFFGNWPKDSSTRRRKGEVGEALLLIEPAQVHDCIHCNIFTVL